VTTIDRFWKRVRKTESCWIWTGTATRKGYGTFYLWQNVPIRSHRFSWMIHFGDVPEESLVCHHCDNRLCVRPDHLFVGSHLDNQRDKVEKRRHARGSRIANAKLDNDRARAILKRIFHGDSHSRIARDFGVSASTVSLISRGKRWAHVFEEV